MLGAMGAAVDLVPCLDAVTNHPTVAVSTPRRHGMDGALETVEGHRPAALGDTDGLVVIITAYVASRHDPLLSTNLIEHSYPSSTTDRRPKFPAPRMTRRGSSDAVEMTEFVFFSSRRRHTRFSRDWSSEVCSSD